MTHWKSGMRLTPARLGEEETGVVLVSFTSQTSHSQTVSFAEPFSAPPTVICEIVSGAGVTGRFEARATNITTTNFLLFILLTDIAEGADTWASQPVNWYARRL